MNSPQIILGTFNFRLRKKSLFKRKILEKV